MNYNMTDIAHGRSALLYSEPSGKERTMMRDGIHY